MINIIIEKQRKKQCIDKISNDKILPHKSFNILMDMEFDEQILLDEICDNIKN